MKTSVYIADDHQIVIDGLMLLLRNEEPYIIAGYANNGKTALEEINKLKPDIVLLDLRMPEPDGLQITRHIREHQLPCKIIILSMHSDTRYVNDAKNFGADGYLLKNTGKAELILAMERVLANELYFPQRKETPQPLDLVLTPREQDVLRLIVNEQTSQQIADQLSLSTYTIETHRKNIMKKTGAKNLAGLVKYAIEQQLDLE
jgi:DNA-binding NarL/FixJ family response regulator